MSECRGQTAEHRFGLQEDRWRSSSARRMIFSVCLCIKMEACVLVMEEDEGNLFSLSLLVAVLALGLDRKERATILISEVLPLGFGLVFGLRLLRRKQTRRDCCVSCLSSLSDVTAKHHTDCLLARKQCCQPEHMQTCIKCEVNFTEKQRETSSKQKQHSLASQCFVHFVHGIVDISLFCKEKETSSSGIASLTV